MTMNLINTFRPAVGNFWCGAGFSILSYSVRHSR